MWEEVEEAFQRWCARQPEWFRDSYPNHIRSKEIKLRRVDTHRYSITPASDIDILRKILDNMGLKYSIHVDERIGWTVSFDNLDDVKMMEALHF